MFIPHFGIVGAAIAILITYALVLVLTTYYCFRYFKFDIDLRSILKSILASIVMSLVIIKWNPAGGISDVLIVIGVCVVIYTAILLLLKGVKKEEIEFFRGLFRV
jgi:O-antigen/teichoic acid export membrane protein